MSKNNFVPASDPLQKARARILASLLRAYLVALVGGVLAVALFVGLGGSLFSWEAVIVFCMAIVVCWHVGWVLENIAARRG